MAKDLELEKKDTDELLEHWKDEIRRGLRYRKQFGLDETWPEYRNYYRHFFEEGTVNTNLVYSSIAAESPSIMYAFPHITVSPLRPGYEAFAYLMESIDNRLAFQQNLADEARDIIIDVATTGVGPIILGYDSQFGYSMKSEGAFEEGKTNTNRDPKTFNRLEYETTVQSGMPWALRCLPEDFLVPWGLSRFSETPWFAFKVVRPLRDVQADPKYDGKARDNIESSKSVDYETHPETDKRFTEGGYPDELQPVFMWEIHDRRTGMVYVISDGCEYFLRKEVDVLQTRLGLPAEVLQFVKDPMYFWGIPEVRYYKAHQQEMNEIIDQRRAFRKAALLRFLIQKGVLASGMYEKLLSGDPVLWLEVENATGIKDALITLQPIIPPDFTSLKEDIWNDVRTVMGKSKPYMGEQLGKTHITATETNTAMQQAGARDMEKREKMAGFIEKVISKENEILFKHWDQNQVQQVVGPDLMTYWVQFKGSQLRSDYLIQVAVDEMAPVTRETKIKEAQGLLELMSKDQTFTQAFPDAAMQIRKTLMAQFSWLNFRSFGPSEGVGNNPQQPMSPEQFAGQFPQMQQRGRGKAPPNLEVAKR